jgi:hypothetical protein
MIATALAAVGLVLAAVPGLLYLRNLALFQPPPPPDAWRPPEGVSVVVPARDEAANIGALMDSVLASVGVELELVVVDDHSSDGTDGLVRARAARDPRVRLVQAPRLPSGWNGKMHALHVGARSARYDTLVFLDADLRATPDALARLAAGLRSTRAALVSGVPQQITRSWLEALIVPLIPFVLLGFLPLGRMRRSTHPAYAAGVGQVFAARREVYRQVGGHAAIRHTRHDGLALPRVFRARGHRTDLLDLTELFRVRMYADAASTFAGFAKNADEGLGRPAVLASLGPALLLGQVLPFALLMASPWLPPAVGPLALAAVALAVGPRLVSRRRFRQPWIGALAHPLAILLLLASQVYGLARARLGHRVAWRGRREPAGGLERLPEVA